MVSRKSKLRGTYQFVKSPITMFNPRCHVNLHQCFHDKVVSALEKRKTETNYQEGKVLIHNCLHCFQICFQILDCYIHSLRRHAVVSACGFFAVIFRRFLSKKIDNQVNRGLVTSFLATTLTYLALLLQYT